MGMDGAIVGGTTTHENEFSATSPLPKSRVPTQNYLYFLIIVGAKKVMGARPRGRNVNIVLEI
jgi:hypothetical protein